MVILSSAVAIVLGGVSLAAEGGPDEAEAVVRLLIFVLGGACVGTAAVYGAFHVWYKQPRPVLTVMQLLGVIGLAGLTGEHVLSHLREGTAPVWQLWGALTSFALLAISFGDMVHRREVAVTTPTVEPGTEDDIIPQNTTKNAPQPSRRTAEERRAETPEPPQ